MMMSKHYSTTEIEQILAYIHPADLSYQDWVNVGMGLKDSGSSAEVWERWSQRDPDRYHSNECRCKWQGFRGSSLPVTAGTIVQMARDRGWKPPRSEGYELDWDAEISADDLSFVRPEWVESKDIIMPGGDWDPVKDLTAYLNTLFEASENVGYVTESYSKDDGYYPKAGVWDRTAGELVQQLEKCKGDIGAVLGDYNADVGAWIRFNPLDGKGCKNDNVTDYRYALVESDKIEVEKQYAIIHELELPVACLVFSGGKSIHAIVKVNAQTNDEYRKRVDYLYKVCQRNGMEVDTQNRNPSRLSRMPGIMRKGQKQFLIETNTGKESWDRWVNWIDGINDDLPNPEGLDSVWDNLPDLSQSLIGGILRQGHKMLIAGPSKAGKSFALIQMIIAIAEGRPWMGFPCTKGRVLYVNLELDRASCLHRFKDVYDVLEWRPDHIGNIDIWNLRGKSVPMDKLAPKLIRRAMRKNYIAIVIDPIYKVITGDENSADQMAKFCNQFDLVCHDLGAAVIYCHHHSKGLQGGKRSMDRASGSGVFARDPDALLDLIELDVTNELLKQETNKVICDVYKQVLNRYGPANWEDQVSQDALCSAVALETTARKILSKGHELVLDAMIEEARDKVSHRTAWRIEGTLREFPRFDPVNVWFDYPIHRIDTVGSLEDLKSEGEGPLWEQGIRAREKNKEKRKKVKEDGFEDAIKNANFGDPPTVDMVMEYAGLSRRTVFRRLDQLEKRYKVEDGKIIENQIMEQ